MKSSLMTTLAAGVLAAVAGTASAAVIGTDNANQVAYDDNWITGDDGAASGDAFGAWTLTAAGNGGFAGHFIGNSTDLGGPGANINVSNESFGMYGNGNANAIATAVRPFNGALSVGQTFSIDIGVNFRNGSKGLNLRNDTTTLFTFNTVGDDYVVSDAATGNGSIGNSYSANTAFNLSFTQTSLSGGTWTIARSGGVSDSDSGTYSGLADNVRLFIQGADGGGSNANNLYANNLTIVPEPASLALLGLGSIAMLRRRK